MSKKEIRTHRSDVPSGTRWQAARLEGVVRNIGIKPVKKPKQTK